MNSRIKAVLRGRDSFDRNRVITAVMDVVKAADALVSVFGDRRAATTQLKANERHWLAKTKKALNALRQAQELLNER